MYWELPPYVVFGFVIPRSVQQVIPIETIWSDGIFKIGRNKFARTYKFTDINYAVASKVDKSTSSNSMVQEKYVTVSCYKKTIEEARTYFHFDIQESMRKGHSFKDYICPDTFEFEKDYFRMGDRYGRVLFLREYASYIKDDMIVELTDMNRNLMLSIDVIPIPTDEAVQEVEKRLLGVETNITNWQRRQNANNNFSAVIPYDLEQQRNTSKYLHRTDGIYHKCRCRLWSGEIRKFACTVRQ